MASDEKGGAGSEGGGAAGVAEATGAPAGGRYRLVTRSDFDGLVCAVLLREKGLIDDILFVHPKDMQDGKVAITERDITTNLPYVAQAHLVFDHHASETLRNADAKPNHLIQADAPSAARVVYDYYGGAAAFPNVSEEMMEAVDKADQAAYSMTEILAPEGWVLLNFIMDPRTGLGRFRNFTVSNYQLMMELIDHCQTLCIDEILALPSVKERVDIYREHESRHLEQIKRCTKVYDNLLVLDLREQETIWAGNRFALYAAFMQCDISMHVMWGRERLNTVFAVGKSILNKRGPAASVNIGEICLRYGGGGHRNAGTCQVPNEHAAEVLDELIEAFSGKRPRR